MIALKPAGGSRFVTVGGFFNLDPRLNLGMSTLYQKVIGPMKHWLLWTCIFVFQYVTAAHAGQVLARFETAAQAAGVPFEGYHDQVPRIDRAIIEAAESRGCDMILMVTHGRGAFGEFLFGSQTKAVLAGSKLPLLVVH